MTADTYGGLPRHCYRTNLLECLPYYDNLQVSDREVWCWVAKVIEKLYAGDATVTDLVAERVVDVEAMHVNLADDELIPQWVMWRAKCGRGVIFAGTTHYQQIALQAFYGSAGPMPVGDFYTNLAWYAVATSMRETMLENIGPHRAGTFLAGHSYGGAVAALIAASESTAQNRDEYSLVTMGAPRFGNGQVYSRITATQSVFLQNEGDPVPSLPPTYPDLLDLLPILLAARYFFWQRWAPPPVQTVLAPDGDAYQSSDWNGGATTASAIAAIVVAGAVMPVFEDHFIAEYRRRICPPSAGTLVRVSGLTFNYIGFPISLDDEGLWFNSGSGFSFGAGESIGLTFNLYFLPIPSSGTDLLRFTIHWFGGPVLFIFTWELSRSQVTAGVTITDMPTVTQFGGVCEDLAMGSVTLDPFDLFGY